MPRVAISGDIVAMAAVPTPAGSWLAGLVEDVVVPGLTIDGHAVLSHATCLFTFTNSVTGASLAVPVELVPSPGAILVNGLSMLLDGQSINLQGNELRVDATPTGPLVIRA